MIRLLSEGTGINATSRISGVSKPTVLRLLDRVGRACADLHNELVRGLSPARVECDEVWSFVFTKEKNVRPEFRGTCDIGDVWLWTGIDPDSKLLISYYVGRRTLEDARGFVRDLSGRIKSVTTLSTDGLSFYRDAIRKFFGEFVNYGQIIKSYEHVQADAARYSPPR